MKLRFGLAPVFTGATYLVQAEAAEKRQKQGYHTVNTSTAVQHCRRTMYEIQVLVLVSVLLCVTSHKEYQVRWE